MKQYGFCNGFVKLCAGVLVVCALFLMWRGATADVGIDAAAVISDSLGYQKTGGGLQIDVDGRYANWGFDAEASAWKHAKENAVGERYQVFVLARRHLGDAFIEAGAEWGGYESRFESGTDWIKYGIAPAVGIGLLQANTEWTVRYFLPDTTPNNTYIVAGAIERALSEHVVIGFTLESWRFKQGGEKLSGTQLLFQYGWRF